MCARRFSIAGSVVIRFVAVDAEGVAGLDRVVLIVLQVPQRNDVVAALLEVDRRTDDQVDLGAVAGAARVVALGRIDRVVVDLRPDRLALAGVGVDHDHRLVWP
jgi:hypothetical protein